MRLNLGCEEWFLRDRGWIDADIDPKSPHVLRMDATQRFPFGDGAVETVFSSHLLEHLTYADGLKMLAECYRVLKPGGRLRIATPDLAFLARLVIDDEFRTEGLVLDYLRFQYEQAPDEIPWPCAAHVVNRFVRAWGHIFVHSEESLRDAMKRAGFERIHREDVGRSDHEEFQCLEPVGRLPPGFFALETMCFEGVRP